MIMLIAQITMGVALKLHLEKGIMGKIRKVGVVCHGILGKLFPIASWVQMLFGGIAALGFCRGEHLGQCLAHFIMGSAFIGYGIVLTLMLLVGQGWLRRTGRSQEFFDSLIIAAWGCVNTFTEHRWGGAWVENDVQHTTMGVIWWCAGLAGMWLSKGKDGRAKRNFIPGFVIFITGWGMSGHPQHLMLSTMVHKSFGYTLMAAGLTRIIEIAFILQDKAVANEDGEPNSFQYVPAFVSTYWKTTFYLTYNVLASVCFWFPVYGRHRRTNGTSLRCWHHPCRICPCSILLCILGLSLRKYAATSIRRQFCSCSSCKG